MLGVKSLQVDLISLNIWRMVFGSDEVNFVGAGGIELNDAAIRMYRRKRDGVLNAEFLWKREGEKEKSQQEYEFSFPDVAINNASFFFVDSTATDSALAAREKLNIHHVKIPKLDFHFGIEIDSDNSLAGQVEKLEFREEISGLWVDSLGTEFEVEPKFGADSLLRLELARFHLKSRNTRLDLDGNAELRDLAGLVSMDSPDSVRLNIRRSKFDFDFAQRLSPRELPLKGIVDLQGPVTWSMKRIRSDSIYLRFGKRTEMLADLELMDYMHPDEMTIDIDFKPADLEFDDVRNLLPSLHVPVAGYGRAKGRIKGDLKRLRSKNFTFDYGNETHLNTKLRLTNILDADDLLMEIDFRKSYFTIVDLHNLLPEVDFPDLDPRIGRVNVDGKFIGGLEDFVVNADINSGIGYVSTDMRLILPPKAPNYEYHGKMRTKNLNLNRSGLFPELDSRDLNFDGNLNGVGFELAVMNTTIDGIFTKSEFFGEYLDSLWTDSLIIRKNKVDGVVTLRDEEGDGHVTVDVDLAAEPARYVLIGDVENVDLNHYGMTSDTVLVRSVFNVNMKGDSLADYEGRMKFFMTEFRNQSKDDTLILDDLVARMKKLDDRRSVLSVKSSFAKVKAEGEFNFASAIDMGKMLVEEAKLYVANQDSTTEKYYAKKEIDSVGTSVSININPGPQTNALLAFTGLEVYLSEDLEIAGMLESDRMDVSQIQITADSIHAFGIGIKELQVTGDATKVPMQDSVMGVAILQMGTAHIGTGLDVHGLTLEATIINNMIEYYLGGSQPELNNRFAIWATTTFLADQILTKIDSDASIFKTGETQWSFKDGNQIVSTGRRIRFENLEFRNGEQLIAVNGMMSESKNDSLFIDIERIPFSTIGEIYSTDLDFDGLFEYYRATITSGLSAPYLVGKGRISDFRYKMVDSLLIDFTTVYEDVPDRREFAAVRTEITKGGEGRFLTYGNYNFRNKKAPIFFEIDSSYVPLSWLEPFTEGIASNYRGKVEIDKFHLRGRLDSLSLIGEGHFQGEKPGQFAGAKIQYLGKEFSLGSKSYIVFELDQIRFPHLVLYDSDSSSNAAFLDGSITHRGLESFEFDLQLTEANNFQVLNTTAEDNELFYGKMVIGTGIAFVTGDLQNIEFRADVATGKGTLLNIPVSDYTSAERLEFVTFTGGNEIAVKEDSSFNIRYTMAFNVNVTEDAKIRMIFDETVGDIIEVEGDGIVNVEMDEHGEMQMRGSYVTTKGNYLFTAQNVVNKRFTLQKGGKITWTGDPYDADLDLSAIYKVRANLKDLLGEEYDQRLPVQINMKMTGSLNNPDIQLAIELDQLTQQDVAGISSYFRNIQYDEQELNKQVVSLLLFGRFAPTSTSQQDNLTGVALTNSISELISNQLNYWLSQSMGSDNFGLEVKTNQFEDVQLGVKAAMFDDRVTFESNGTIVGNQSSNVSIGNLSIQIKLLPVNKDDQEGEAAQPDSLNSENKVNVSKGRLVMEIFRRESNDMTANNTKTGVGVFYKKDFDTIGELFGGDPNKRKEKKSKDKKVLEED